MLLLANLTDSLVTKAEVYAETTKYLQQVVIVTDEGYHLVTRFIHFLIFHNVSFSITPFIYMQSNEFIMKQQSIFQKIPNNCDGIYLPIMLRK